MTRTITLGALTALVIALAAPSARAQEASSAARVAASVQAFYDQTTTVRTSFHQTHYDRIYQRTTRSRGVLTIARPGKMRFDYLAGSGKVVVTDGRALTVYEPDEDGSGGQYARRDLDDGLPSALGFLAGTARLDRDFTFRLRDPSSVGWDGHVLELRPRRAEPAYRRVLLFVDDDAATAGVVRKVLVQDHEGNLNLFEFRRTRFNAPVADDRFVLEMPVGARRI